MPYMRHARRHMWRLPPVRNRQAALSHHPSLSRGNGKSLMRRDLPLKQRRLRRDVTTWARDIGFSPQMSIADPDTVIDFIGDCIERYPGRFTHEHGSEIFAWCREEVAFVPDGPEAA
jgi:hypothetical protein